MWGFLNTGLWGMLEGTRDVPRGQEGKGGLEVLWEHQCAQDGAVPMPHRDTQSLPTQRWSLGPVPEGRFHVNIAGSCCWGQVLCPRGALCDTPLQPLWSVSGRTGTGREHGAGEEPPHTSL